MHKECQNKKSKGSLSKADSLNLNMKKEILNFLPFIQKIEVLKLSKHFAFAVKDIKYIKNIKANFIKLIEESNFLEEVMLPIIERIKTIDESETCKNQIAEYLLTRKIRDFQELDVKTKTVIQEPFFKMLTNAIKINLNINSLILF